MPDEQYPKNEDHTKDDHDLNFDVRDEFTEPWNEGHVPLDTDTYEEETAAELAAVRPVGADTVDATSFDADEDLQSGRGAGIFAVVLSILSLFFLPILLGISGIVVGFISRRVGATALGNWAIGIGALSIIMKVFFSPFF